MSFRDNFRFLVRLGGSSSTLHWAFLLVAIAFYLKLGNTTGVGDQWCENCLRNLITIWSNIASKIEFLLRKIKGCCLLLTFSTFATNFVWKQLTMESALATFPVIQLQPLTIDGSDSSL